MPRNAAPTSPPVVCTVAGSDSGGGAGIQADLKTIEAGGGFGTSVLTAVTAQNTVGVDSTHVLPVEEIDAQATAVFGDFEVAAVKTGMLATEPVIDLVADRVRSFDGPAVVDPVMVAASGDRLLDPDAEDAYEDLIAEATLVTPNADEAAVLTGVEVTDPEAAREAGEAVVGMGAEAALVKGGHVPGEAVVDVLVTGDRAETYRHERVDTDATHGSGCALSSAVATELARGRPLSEAVQAGVDLLARAVRYNLDVGEGPGSVHHLVGLRERADRHPVTERVTAVVRALADADVSGLVPEVGMNVVGATGYAETPTECAAVEGRLTRALDGLRTGDVRFGASGHVARALLAAREHDGTLRFAANCRTGADVRAALPEAGVETVTVDRTNDSDPDAAATADRVIDRAVDAHGGVPGAVLDEGAHGTEPVCRLLAPDAATLVDRLVGLSAATGEDQPQE